MEERYAVHEAVLDENRALLEARWRLMHRLEMPDGPRLLRMVLPALRQFVASCDAAAAQTICRSIWLATKGPCPQQYHTLWMSGWAAVSKARFSPWHYVAASTDHNRSRCSMGDVMRPRRAPRL
jgi:hypothetical protein